MTAPKNMKSHDVKSHHAFDHIARGEREVAKTTSTSGVTRRELALFYGGFICCWWFMRGFGALVP